MSKIGKTSDNIKKKLSFDDYSKPADQLASKPVSQPKDIPTQQQTVKPAEQYASNNDQVSQHPSLPVSQQAFSTASKQVVPKENKIKATYYLGEHENYLLTEIYINRLRSNNKADKSALICEAIKLLYEKYK